MIDSKEDFVEFLQSLNFRDEDEVRFFYNLFYQDETSTESYKCPVCKEKNIDCLIFEFAKTRKGAVSLVFCQKEKGRYHIIFEKDYRAFSESAIIVIHQKIKDGIIENIGKLLAGKNISEDFDGDILDFESFKEITEKLLIANRELKAIVENALSFVENQDFDEE